VTLKTKKFTASVIYQIVALQLPASSTLHYFVPYLGIAYEF